MDKIKAGDLVWYKTVIGRSIKAKVLSTRDTVWYGGVDGMHYATIRVTSHGDRAFPCGYVFETSPTWMTKR